MFTATVLLQETGWMKTYQSVKNDAFERVSQIYLCITALSLISKAWGLWERIRPERTSVEGRIGHPATNTAGICDIGAVQGREFPMNGAGMKAKKLLPPRKRSMDAWQPYTQEFGVFFWNLESAYFDGRRYRWEYLRASDSLEHIRTGWISKLQCCDGSHT